MSALSNDHVVILGAGYAGLTCALKLASLRHHHSRFRITLVARENRQELTCEFYRSLRWGDNVLLPFRDLLSASQISFVEGRALSIDPLHRKLIIKGGEQSELSYDHLVLALGRKTQWPAIENFTEIYEKSKSTDPHIFHFRSQAQVQSLRLALKRLRWEDPLPRSRDSFVIVLGAGSTGIEVAGELAAMRARNPQCRVVLVDERPELLTDFSPVARKVLKKQLAKMQIETVLGSRAQRMLNQELHLQNGQVLPWDLLVVCAGSAPAESILKPFHAGLDAEGLLKVDSQFRVSSFPRVYAIGDNARIPYPSSGLQNLRFVPHRAQFAVQEGVFLAELFADYFKTGSFPKRIFDPQDLGYLVSLGPQRGVGRVGPEIPGKFKKLLSPFVYGPVVNELKRVAYLKYLAQLKSFRIRHRLLNSFLTETLLKLD